MLRWAREWRGRSLEETAKKISKSKTAQDIADWENPENVAAPTVSQARILADFYDRAFLEFFLPNPPPIQPTSQIADFRVYKGQQPDKTWELDNFHRWAESQRANALELYTELGESPLQMPDAIFTSLEVSPDVAANKARELLEFPIEAQTGLTSAGADALPTILRKKFEALGVLTFRESGLKHLGVRGICVAAFPLPVIVFTSESPTAQAFTLVHEFGHILLKESGITGPRSPQYESQPIEKWCDRFAAAFLMPPRLIQALLGEKPLTPHPSITDEALDRLAKSVRVSPHAMLIRLVYLGYVNPAYYWDVKKQLFDSTEANYKGFGIPKIYASRYRSHLGDLYTGLVMDAWSNSYITNDTAAQYMGIKKFAYLDQIRKTFQA